MKSLRSFPTRERGLKSHGEEVLKGAEQVVPHAGTWIEIEKYQNQMKAVYVVPHAGTWIEIVLLPVFLPA